VNTRTERAARTIAALPEDGWGEVEWDSFVSARSVFVEELARIDRRNAAKTEYVKDTGPKVKVASRRRKPDPPELVKAKAEVRERSGGLCEARIPEVCQMVAHDAHHILRRGQGGPHTAENLVDLCYFGGCHDAAHANPDWAKRHGFIRSPGGALIAPVAGCSLSCDVDHRPTADQP